MISISLEQLRRSKSFLLGDNGYEILSATPQYIHGSLARVYLLMLREDVEKAKHRSVLPLGEANS